MLTTVTVRDARAFNLMVSQLIPGHQLSPIPSPKTQRVKKTLLFLMMHLLLQVLMVKVTLSTNLQVLLLSPLTPVTLTLVTLLASM